VTQFVGRAVSSLAHPATATAHRTCFSWEKSRRDAQPGASREVAVLWNGRVSTYVYYDGELARTNSSSNNVSGGVRIAF